MTRIEIETITEAMVTKQTWIRKELKDFLEVWADITKEKISEYNTFVLYEYDQNSSYLVTNRIILKRGINEVDFEYNDGDDWRAVNDKNYLDIDEMSMFRIRKIIKNIYEKLPGYFKAIQADIGEIDETGRNIRSIIEKLK